MNTGAEARVPALEGVDIAEEDRSSYNSSIIVKFGGGRSQNVGPNHARNDLAWSYYHDRSRMDRIFDAWIEYAKQPFCTSEPVPSCHVYGSWIVRCLSDVRGIAILMGRDDVADVLLPHLLTFRCLAALAAGWRRHRHNQSWLSGYPSMLTGARSFTSRKIDGERRDENGRPNVPWVWEISQGTFAGNRLMEHLHYPRTDDEALRRLIGPGIDPFGTTDRQRRYLRRISRNQGSRRQFEKAVEWINRGPEFAIPARIVRTDECVAFVALKSIAPRSTSFMYAKIWYADRRPVGSYWDDHFWETDPQIGWVAVDPSMRSRGRSGVAKLVERRGRLYVRAQRSATNDWYDSAAGRSRSGWFEAEIPGAVTAHVRLIGNRRWRTHPKETKAELIVPEPRT